MLVLAWLICFYVGPEQGTIVYSYTTWDDCQAALEILDPDGERTTDCYRGWVVVP